MKYRTILLFGAPGSGKGTQGVVLGRIPGFVHVSCGEIFRSMRVGSPLASVFLDYSSRGALVPDEFSIQLWSEYIHTLAQTRQFDPDNDILILDGIPRNVAQARLMTDLIDVLRIYYLESKDVDAMILRLKRRALRENRLDDLSDRTIQNRLYVYEAESAPVLRHYPEEIIKRIDTGRTPVEVLADILADMKNLVQKAELKTIQQSDVE